MEFKLKAEKRDETGKGAARKARERGEVPAVMYGLGGAPVSLLIKKEDLTDVLGSAAGTNVLLDLQVTSGKDKDNYLVMIKELQRHPFKEKLLHVDFLKVARDTKVSMRVPITITGEEESVGLKAGGTLQHNLWEVEIECLPGDVPDHVFIDIADADIGDHLSVSDLNIPAGITVLADPGDVVLTLLAPRLIVEEEVEEAEGLEAREEGAPAEEISSEGATGEGGEE
ncbi:MAG TPA: 50S ribosomal protein L25 [Candidatus Anoxymicrobiaceae bacterium]